MSRYLQDNELEHQLDEIRKDPTNIVFIENPCDEAQVLAVTLNPSVYHDIENPCESARDAYRTYQEEWEDWERASLEDFLKEYPDDEF